jgi:hypothetical protein
VYPPKAIGDKSRCPSTVQAAPGTAALIVIANLFRSNVSVSIQNDQVLFKALKSQAHAEALLRLASDISWPHMIEARETMYKLPGELQADLRSCHPVLTDWMYGLVLPGKYFRHRIMTCLVLSCPSTRHLTQDSTHLSGVILQGQSYWPKTTVISRVFAAVEDVRIVSGWVGPLSVPSCHGPSWGKVSAKALDLPERLEGAGDKTYLEACGFTRKRLCMSSNSTLHISRTRPSGELLMSCRPGPSKRGSLSS